ncbi:hypothetical protein K438DRAFT_1964389 [Mycena galopus ATCC 62051]|nr:hypothetical protein K438DRAFT_1964389 [Mycena galopus ATCC 62051]
MFFNRFHFFAFIFLFRLRKSSALTFGPITGPYITGAEVQIQWTLDGSEPANGWDLWFDMGGSAMKVANISPQTTATAVPFPGSGGGTFRGLSGITVLATSNKIDAIPFTFSLTATATFSASIISGPSSVSSSASSQTSFTSTSTLPPTSSLTAESATATSAKSSGLSTEAVLVIIVGTMAVIVLVVIAFVSFLIFKRRRAKVYPPGAAEVQKLLAGETPHHDSKGGPPAIRWSAPQVSPLYVPNFRTSVSSAGDSRRPAYLNSSLQQVQLAPQHTADSESGSVAFNPVYNVPADIPQLAGPQIQLPPTSPSPSTSPPISESSSPGALGPHMVPLPRSEGSVASLSPSSASSSSSASDQTARLYAPSVSTIHSPLQFRNTASDMAPPRILLALTSSPSLVLSLMPVPTGYPAIFWSTSSPLSPFAGMHASTIILLSRLAPRLKSDLAGSLDFHLHLRGAPRFAQRMDSKSECNLLALEPESLAVLILRFSSLTEFIPTV